jgi:hypothetical protein
MILKQRNILRAYEFHFGDTAVSYTIKGPRGERTVSIPYTGISSLETERTKSRLPIFRLIAFVIVVSMLFVNLSHPDMPTNERALGTGLYLLVALLFEFLYRKFMLGYTNYKTSKGVLSIMQTKNHDAVAQVLKENWIRRMRELHGRIDPLADPHAERGKLKWLREHAIISEQEYMTMAAELQNFLSAGGQGSKTLN